MAVRRIALIGAGFIARVHAEALQFLPGVRLTAIVDPKHDAAERLARSYGAARVFTGGRRRARGGRVRLRPRSGATTGAS